MSTVIICASHGSPALGAYLAKYDPDAQAGQGQAWWTKNLANALRFDDPDKAMTFYTQTSAARPKRDDGKPNRPLTAYPVELVDETQIDTSVACAMRAAAGAVKQ